jgi:hypothetical protein
MLILFDQGTPVAIRKCLPDHVVKTAYEQGWSALSRISEAVNGEAGKLYDRGYSGSVSLPSLAVIFQRR